MFQHYEFHQLHAAAVAVVKDSGVVEGFGEAGYFAVALYCL